MIWGSLAFCLVAVLGSLAVAVVRGLRLWRTFRSTSRTATDAVARVAEAAAAAERRASGLTAKSERLTAAIGRLQEALGELGAIRAAAAEPQALLATLRGAVPKK